MHACTHIHWSNTVGTMSLSSQAGSIKNGVGKDLHLTKQQIYGLVQLESLQVTIFSLTEMTESYQKDGKHCRKKRNRSLQAISPFPSVFKRLVLQTHKK